ncbi:UDP-N-acetylglucosamine--N-acetylmuramyl-(pentapeptide) pyrophosphoryl-undecaprenol N-acetylglucosamine transferase [Actinomyces faecalis]|uniref:UDP-N-acetylglucosamine--N-acetylmuramyl- (pentapeptide) pyrophosphoryl-undecaprenol N-acetylglucosamine transferase n=1 Tax=Actinomyces faecalis TaxID=2722820 RepID=UPI001552EC97|nr:UDP-N-acetylglucosamine--N-acetylmuramyl-(pentapeptide) pyrophosphoryl-undecaprenol N-acetylglucosamine transferase [Actinomyces faecalis]
MPDTQDHPLRVLLAGGGTAGHVNPLLATAAALRDPALGGGQETRLLVLGTKEGLESELVPQAGYELALVPRVPMPRRPGPALVRLPGRLRGAVAAARQALESIEADVVVGFGGYVSTPAYLAARQAGLPVVIHEQNARPGLANRLGARWASAVALTFASTPLAARHGRTEVTGLPLRPAIAELVAAGATSQEAGLTRREGAQALGLDPQAPTLLVTGGSLGAQRLNEVLTQALGRLPHELQVLHLTGRGKDGAVRHALEAAAASGSISERDASRYHVLDYLTRMELAYACADGVICRSGAGTVAELTALGLPALYVPLPVGNGEQRLNAADVVRAGGGRLVPDAQLDVQAVVSFTQVLTDPAACTQMAQAAASTGVRDGAARLARLVRETVSSHRPGQA